MAISSVEAERAQDAALTLAAQNGDVASLAGLLERHRPGMRAVALGVLGPGPDVEDVLQDAALVALRRIGDVREPSSAGAWLRMLVRNRARSLLREASRSVPLEEVSMSPVLTTPEQVLDEHLLRDWIWEAVEALSPALRLPVVLRYFSVGVTSYQEIAEACGVPVGTVRSRLSLARAGLVRSLEATAEGMYEDTRGRTAAAWAEAHATLAAAERGEFRAVVADRWSPELSLLSGRRRLGGVPLALAGMEGDLSAGVRQRPAHVTAGRSLIVWEMDLINPPEAPDHCPPGVAWIMTVTRGRIDRLSLHHAARPARAREGGRG